MSAGQSLARVQEERQQLQIVLDDVAINILGMPEVGLSLALQIATAIRRCDLTLAFALASHDPQLVAILREQLKGLVK